MKRNKCMLIMKMAIAIIFLACILFFWTHAAEKTTRNVPDYPMEDISVCLEQEILTEEEYFFLYYQTGLSRLAVDALCEENRSEELLAAQERFFAEVETTCECDFPMFREVIVQADDLTNPLGVSEFIPVLEDGDILITFNSHFLGWRNGHAAIVIDAERGLTLEALMLGKDSTVLPVSSWRDCPSFAVLRLTGASKERRAEIADYAEENLKSIPYRLTAGVWDAFGVSGSHCSHLVWYAYNQFGYDLDSDGGQIVTPRDLFNSPLLKVVQVYGMKPI